MKRAAISDWRGVSAYLHLDTQSSRWAGNGVDWYLELPLLKGDVKT